MCLGLRNWKCICTHLISFYNSGLLFTTISFDVKYILNNKRNAPLPFISSMLKFHLGITFNKVTEIDQNFDTLLFEPLSSNSVKMEVFWILIFDFSKNHIFYPKTKNVAKFEKKWSTFYPFSLKTMRMNVSESLHQFSFQKAHLKLSKLRLSFLTFLVLSVIDATTIKTFQ